MLHLAPVSMSCCEPHVSFSLLGGSLLCVGASPPLSFLSLCSCVGCSRRSVVSGPGLQRCPELRSCSVGTRQCARTYCLNDTALQGSVVEPCWCAVLLLRAWNPVDVPSAGPCGLGSACRVGAEDMLCGNETAEMDTCTCLNSQAC